MVNQILNPLILIFVSALVLPLISRIGEYLKFPKLRDFFAFFALTISMLLIVTMVPSVPLSYHVNIFGPPFGIELHANMMSIYLALLSITMILLVTFYSIKYMEVDNGLEKYYTLILTLTGGIVGLVFSQDFFTLYVFWELICISSYTLVSFRKYRWQAVEGGIKYLLMSTIGSLIALYGISMLYGVAGTLNFSSLADIIEKLKPNLSLYFIILTIVVGFGMSSAIVPFHSWIPDAYVGAPNCIASISTVILKISAFNIIRSLMIVFNPTIYNYGLILVCFGLLSLTFGNFLAVTQKDIRRLLAFSSVSNMGYIFTGLGIASYIIYTYGYFLSYAFEIAMIGVFLHMMNHVFGKGLLFMSIGNFSVQTKNYSINSLEGLMRKMPLSSFSSAVGLLGLAGVPPLSGFWSKLFIIASAATVLSDPILLVTLALLVFNSVFDAAYYVWVFQKIVFRPVSEKGQSATEVSVFMWLPVVILATLLIIITIRLDLFITFVRAALWSLFGGV
ncbi:MAG: proton-conducting transporter membrane subunit [Nitrososphaeria archaeon]